MENRKSPLRICKEKMSVVHTTDEIKSAFDSSFYSVCFNYDRGYSGARHELFAAIWEVNPDVIITTSDLVIMSDKVVIWRDQLLLIDKNGNRETADTIIRFMEESSIISYEYRIFDENGVKVCFGPPDCKNPSATTCFSGELQVDGDKLILTTRI